MKKRLIGAIVLVALVVIFVPMLVEEKTTKIELGPLIPAQPQQSVVTHLLPPESVTTIAEPVDATVAGRYELPAAEVMQPPVESGSGLPTEIVIPTEVIKPDNDAAVVDPEPSMQVQQPPKKVAEEPSPKKQLDIVKPVMPEAVTGKVVTQGWVVQAASFGQSNNAEALKQRLLASGRAAFIEPTEVKGKMLYRVRVGPIEKRVDADRQLAQIEAEFKLKGRVVAFP